MMGDTGQYLDWARRMLHTEALGPNEIADALDGDFIRTADALLHCKDHVIITGMDKSGHASRRIAATVTSAGTPVFFVHPTEAAHGDLGTIVDSNIVAAISSSGESDEITVIMPTPKRKNVTSIGITARPASTLARHADIHIVAAVSKEACLLGLVPITSTTAVMALGDALVVVLLRARALIPDGFTLSYPVGSLGKRLLPRVAGIMHSSDALPVVVGDTLLKEAIVRMNEKGLSMLVVADEADRLKGVLIGGSLCRLFQQRDSFAGLTVDDIMRTSPKTITANKLTTEALKRTQVNHINGLLVTEADGTLTGALNMHDLLIARIV